MARGYRGAGHQALMGPTPAPQSAWQVVRRQASFPETETEWSDLTADATLVPFPAAGGG